MATTIKLDIDDSIREYFYSIKDTKPLKRKEERKLLLDYRLNGNIKSRDRLITSNLKYACTLANAYRNKGVDFSELISEANDGLIEAIEKYDLSQDVKLITYARWWITQRIRACLAREYNEQCDDLPTDREKQCEDDEEVIVNQDFNKLFVDEDIYDKKNDKKLYLNKLLTALTEREKTIISCYYGLYGKMENLESIGDNYGITKERVRQIIEHSLKKIRTKALIMK